MRSDRGKTWKTEAFESVLGHGAVFGSEEEGPGDLTDSLTAALTAWGDMSDNAENAMSACLPQISHTDPRVRAVAVSAISKLVPKRTRLHAEALAAISRALSDSDTRVRESAETAAQLLHEQNGITIDRTPI